MRTNDGAPNFRLMSTAEGDTGRAAWREELAHRDDVLFEGFELFDRFLVLAERREGLEQLRIEPVGDAAGEGHDLDFGEPTYSAGLGVNPDPSSGTLRYVYQSLTTPRSVFDYDPATREKTLRKQDQVLGGFDPANYRSERLWATARGRYAGAGVARLPARPALRRTAAVRCCSTATVPTARAWTRRSVRRC